MEKINKIFIKITLSISIINLSTTEKLTKPTNFPQPPPPSHPVAKMSFQDSFTRLHQFTASPRRRSLVYNRSHNLSYPDIHRMDDATKYNTSVKRVTHYQNSPNRLGTPKKPPDTLRPVRARTFLRCGLEKSQDSYLTGIMNSWHIRDKARKELTTLAQTARISFGNKGPMFRKVRGDRGLDVYNDFHIRETNPGFARNEYGGFFTH